MAPQTASPVRRITIPPGNTLYISLIYREEKEMFKLYTTDEVAEIMKVSPRTIRKEVKASKLKGIMIRGQIRFREDEIERYLQENSWSYRGRKVSGDTVTFA